MTIDADLMFLGLPAIHLILDDVSVEAPEPTTLALLGTGLFGLAMMRRRKRGRASSPLA